MMFVTVKGVLVSSAYCFMLSYGVVVKSTSSANAIGLYILVMVWYVEKIDVSLDNLI